MSTSTPLSRIAALERENAYPREIIATKDRTLALADKLIDSLQDEVIEQQKQKHLIAEASHVLQ